jgi:hypothetical protein
LPGFSGYEDDGAGLFKNGRMQSLRNPEERDVPLCTSQ